LLALTLGNSPKPAIALTISCILMLSFAFSPFVKNPGLVLRLLKP
jgi:hypothetical protein